MNVKCNQCLWTGDVGDIDLIEDVQLSRNENPIKYRIPVCPKCKSQDIVIVEKQNEEVSNKRHSDTATDQGELRQS